MKNSVSFDFIIKCGLFFALAFSTLFITLHMNGIPLGPTITSGDQWFLLIVTVLIGTSVPIERARHIIAKLSYSKREKEKIKQTYRIQFAFLAYGFLGNILLLNGDLFFFWVGIFFICVGFMSFFTSIFSIEEKIPNYFLHPERKWNEVLITNINADMDDIESANSFGGIRYRTKRVGNIAYDIYGKRLNHSLPVFVSRWEYRMKKWF